MKVNCFLLCDYATFTIDRKLIVNGVFEQIQVVPQEPVLAGVNPAFPLPKSFLVARMEFSLADGLEHRVAVVVLDEDENEVSRRAPTAITVALNQNGRPMVHNYVAEATGLPLRSGDYRFVLVIDDEPRAEFGFYLWVAKATN